MNLILFSFAVILNLDPGIEEDEEDVVVVLEVRVTPEDVTIVTRLGILPKIAPKKIINFFLKKKSPKMK